MKASKCILSFLLAIVMILGILTFTGLTAQAANYAIDKYGNCPSSITIDLKDGNTATIGITIGGYDPRDEIVRAIFSVNDTSIATVSNTGEIYSSTTVTVTALSKGSTKIVVGIWFPGDDYPTEKEIPLTVKETVQKYTVTYDANGGTGTAPTESDKEAGEKFTAAANTFTAPAGKQFVNWNLSKDGTGTSYAAGSSVTMPEGSLILYAVWEDDETSSSTPSSSSIAPSSSSSAPSSSSSASSSSSSASSSSSSVSSSSSSVSSTSSSSSKTPIPVTGNNGGNDILIFASLSLIAVLLFVALGRRKKIENE